MTEGGNLMDLMHEYGYPNGWLLGCAYIIKELASEKPGIKRDFDIIDQANDIIDTIERTVEERKKKGSELS